MALSWNEIKGRALAFSKEWEGETSEDAEAKSFWDGFFNIFGISRKRLASFEEPVRKLGEKQGFIDLFWKGVMLVEHKSRGKNLDKAYTQALDYFPGITERDLPRYVLVSDFARFRLYDLENGGQHEFELGNLHKNVRLFGFMAGYQTHKIREEDPVNIQAAERMGKLHDQMKAVGYEGHPLELYLVRLLFCLFADDNGLFQLQQFQDYIEQRTSEDGSDLAYHLSALFQVLNTSDSKRLTNQDEQLAAFPYVNGKLFEETLPMAAFDRSMRQSLLDCCSVNWSRISPAIFGSLFQSIMDKTARRNLGAHYTSEKNILKLIKPLFLDALRDEFEKIKTNRNKLIEFHKKLRSLTFLDPACGCGNFLVIAYRELRLLELDLLRAVQGDGQMLLDVHALILLDVDQFYGIELSEFPAQIAQVALWLTDHQMNLRVSEEFGQYFARIPLKTSANIVQGNALQMDWNAVIPAPKLSYIMGNPPFGGKHYQSKEQREDQRLITTGIKSGSDLDYVSNWFLKSAEFAHKHSISMAFVATNSIVQGEQVSLLWLFLLTKYDIHIFFAHRTFRWSNEARGKAAVHCVIIGFSEKAPEKCRLYDYETVTSDPFERCVHNINPYLVDGPSVVVQKRKHSLSSIPPMKYGNKPTDDGNFILSTMEKDSLLAKEPSANRWLRKYMGSEDFINGLERWCLWLEDIKPDELRKLPEVLKRVENVRKFRLSSTALPTQKSAMAPTKFFYISQPHTEYIVVPEVSSERRPYIPIGFMSSDVICSNTNYLVPNANLFIFGVLTSVMHMAWMRTVCGRLKSDYRYSGSIVYNNFPWPESPTDKQKETIEAAAQGVLDARAQFPKSSLADLYDPLSMPPVLLKAHQALDRAVDAAYGRTNFKTEAERVAFLFALYQKYVSLFPAEGAVKAKRKSTEQKREKD